MKAKALALSVLLTFMYVIPVSGDVKDKPISSATIVTNPQRIVYDIGEDVDLYGMRVKIVFEDGEEYTATQQDLTYSGYNSKQEGSQLITANYGDYSIPFSVTVKTGALSSISIKANKPSTSWITGDTIKPNDFTVTANYDVGSKRKVDDFEYDIHTLKSGRNTITIRYLDKTSTVILDAKDNTCQTIRIDNPGTSTFNIGEPFNWNGLKVLAHYLDGSDRDVTKECTVKGVSTVTKGDYYVEVTFDGKRVTYPIHVVNSAFKRMDTSKWRAESTIDLYFNDRETPITVTAKDVVVTDDNTSGIRSYAVTYAGKTYYENTQIPTEDKRYLGSNRVIVEVPIGIKLAKNKVGVRGYVPKTTLQSSSKSPITIEVTPNQEIPTLRGWNTPISFPEAGNQTWALDITGDISDSGYHTFNARLEVNQ